MILGVGVFRRLFFKKKGVEMGKQKVWFLIIVCFICYSCKNFPPPRITINNNSQTTIFNLVLKTTKFSETVESIKSGYTVSFPFRLNGESNIKLSFETPTEGIKKEKIILSWLPSVTSISLASGYVCIHYVNIILYGRLSSYTHPTNHRITK